MAGKAALAAGPDAAVKPDVALAEAFGARLDNGTESATLTFDLSAGVETSAFVLADPDRVIVDLPRVDFVLDPKIGRPGGRHAQRSGLVESFRFGLLSSGRSRVVIDLRGPARIARSVTQKDGDKVHLVIELAKTDRAAFEAASRNRALEAAAVSVAADTGHAPVATPVVASASRPVIVLDPGHGGPDTGAIVNGVVEKMVALAFAEALEKKLEATGGFTVVMTRASDVFIPLSERVRIARAANAALMVSIHADTLTESDDVGGATVYTVSEKASDAAAAKVAAKENAADATVGVDGQADAVDVSDILFDLTRRETRAFSHVFARTLVNYWKVAGRLNKNPERAAGFRVLKAPDVPSVLLELGYLSNPTDAASLTSDTWRDKATTRMAQAITAYFADRLGPEKAAAGVTMPDVGKPATVLSQAEGAARK